jgi:hypothetical protein
MGKPVLMSALDFLVTTINILVAANQSKKFLSQLFEAEEPTL